MLIALIKVSFDSQDKQNESHVRNQLKKEERELDDIINSRYQFQGNFQN